jgi:Mg-chelatase subunit ChlD
MVRTSFVERVRSFFERMAGSDHTIDGSAINHEVVDGKPLEILIFDVSGSMEEADYPPSRLEAAKKAAGGFLKRLSGASPESAVSIISFSNHARLVCAPEPVGNGTRQVQRTIKALRTEGYTNTTSGLEMAGRLLRAAVGARRPRVVLLTDGHANKGGSPEQAAERLKAQGVQIDIVGIGGGPEDVNEAQLRRMASIVNGERRYWFIKSVGSLVRTFEALALREVRR